MRICEGSDLLKVVFGACNVPQPIGCSNPTLISIRPISMYRNQYSETYITWMSMLNFGISYRPDQKGRLRYNLPDMTLERSCVLFILIVAVIQCTFQHKQQYIVG